MDFNQFKFEHHTFYTKQTEDINKAIIYDQYMKPFFFLLSSYKKYIKLNLVVINNQKWKCHV